ncbi:LysR family transcriptional regulator [Pseudomonas sp. EpS/L25]|uniref:LysR family transcriptional regulator n=1 Tax=Pseudomonas sp. EpS/L25 TaxID=1749078 RepID=UPI0009E94E38|nr:LysR family transcriptional regulator [Pseudomonas sp. EpS/L25]
MRVNLDIQALRVFIKISELRSFTRAAEALYVTQPAISQQIRRLEESLEAQLFIRDNKQALLTLEGEKLLKYAREIVTSNDKIGEIFGEKPIKQTVTIGMPEHFCEQVLPQIISGMASLLPSIQLIVKVARSVFLSELVNDGKVDVGLIIDEMEHMPETIWHSLAVTWFSSENLSLTQEGHIPLALFKAPCGFRSLAIRKLEESGIRWQCAYESEDLISLRSAVQAGVGITVLPDLSDSKGLRKLDNSETLPQLPKFAVGLKQRDGWNPPYKQDLINIIRSVWTSEKNLQA